MLGQNIKALRIQHNLTQEQLADDLGLSAETIAAYENGESEPGPEVIFALCGQFLVSLDDLYAERPLEEEPTEAEPIEEDKPMPKSAFTNRIKSLRLQQGLSQIKLAKILGIAQSTLSGWENDKFQIDDAGKVKLADFFHVSIDYLLGRSESKPATVRSDHPSLFEETEKIPVIRAVKCTGGTLSFEYTDTYISLGDSYPGDILALSVTTDNMRGLGILAGDIAIVRREDELAHGSLCAAAIGDEPVMLYRLYRTESDLLLESADPSCPLRIFTEEAAEVQLIGRVIEVRKTF